MKTTKKQVRSIEKPAPAPKTPLSPRQLAALRKLYRFLTVIGILAVVGTVGTLFSLHGSDVLLWGAKKRVAQKPAEMRDPKLNPNTPPGPAPEGMVWIPGGEFYMGVDPEKFPGNPDDTDDAAVVHLVYVDGFWMDKTEVTNEAFAKFVKATGYVTDAEKSRRRSSFPNMCHRTR